MKTEEQLAAAPLLGTVAVLVKHLWVMIIIPVVVVAIAVASNRMHREWSAVSKITPQGSSDNFSGLLGVASQFGVTAGGSRQNESVDFYADLFKSRELLDSLAVTRFTFPTGPGDSDTLSGTYIDLYQIKAPTEFDRILRARRQLDGKVSVSLKRPSAVVTIQTKARWGQLAELMNRRLLDLTNQFNLKRRQTQAGSERAFLEGRLAEVTRDIDSAQAVYRAFLQRNRVYQDDPALSAQAQNLARKVAEVQQTHDALVQSYERARADEVRNTPVFTIVESPEGSRRRSGGLLITGLLGVTVGLVLAAAVAVGLEYIEQERARFPDAYAEIKTSWRSRLRRRSAAG